MLSTILLKSTNVWDVRLNNLRDAVNDGRIKLKILSTDNVADALTKALAKERFSHSFKRDLISHSLVYPVSTVKI